VATADSDDLKPKRPKKRSRKNAAGDPPQKEDNSTVDDDQSECTVQQSDNLLDVLDSQTSQQNSNLGALAHSLPNGKQRRRQNVSDKIRFDSRLPHSFIHVPNKRRRRCFTDQCTNTKANIMCTVCAVNCCRNPRCIWNLHHREPYNPATCPTEVPEIKVLRKQTYFKVQTAKDVTTV
jgi:hypothetical protein